MAKKPAKSDKSSSAKSASKTQKTPKLKLPPIPPLKSKKKEAGFDLIQKNLDRPVVDGIRIDRDGYLDEKIHSGVTMPYILPFFDPLQNLQTTTEMQNSFRRMLSFPEVNSAFYNIVLAVMSMDLKVHPVDKKNKRDVEVSRFVEWNLKHRVKGGVPGIIHNVMAHAGIDGYSVCEKVWEIQLEGLYKGKRVLKDLKPKDTIQDLMPILDSFRNIIGIRALRYNDGTVFHPNDFLIYSRLPLYDNPLGISMFRAAYQPYWYLDTATKIRFQAMEKRALPIIVGETDATQLTSMMRVLSVIKSQNWLAVPRDTKVQVLDIAGSSNEIFEKFCRDQQTRILLALNGAELQSMSSGANSPRGDSSIHENTMELRTFYLAASFCEAINNEDTGLIVDMVRGQQNFAGITEFPKITLSGINDSDLKASLEIDLGLQQMNFPMSIDELSERYNRKVPTEPDDEIVPPEQEQTALDHHLQEQSRQADRKHEKSMGGSGGGGSSGGGKGKGVKSPTTKVGDDSKDKGSAFNARSYIGVKGGRGHINAAGKVIYESKKI